MKKDFSLEGLRGIASLNVFIGHYLFVFFPFTASDVRPSPYLIEPHYLIERILLNPPFTFFYLADAAVLIFFVLSGYVLTKRFYDTGNAEELRSAAARRYVRLVFPVAASVLFAWLILRLGLYGNHLAGALGVSGWILPFYQEKVSLGSALLNGFFGAPILGDAAMNGPLWSIQIELIGSILLFACYALFLKNRLQLVLWFFLFGVLPNEKYWHALRRCHVGWELSALGTGTA